MSMILQAFIFLALLLDISFGCMSSNCPSKCSSCSPPELLTGTNYWGTPDVPVTLVSGTDANGCNTVQMSCSSTAEVIQSLRFNNVVTGFAIDGTADPTPESLTRSMTCDANGNYIYTSPSNSTIQFMVNQVECNLF